jgi:hypothetical protein
MIVGPLALMAMIRGKRKAGKVDQFLVVVIVGLTVGVMITGCSTPSATTPSPTLIPSPTPTIPPTATSLPTDPDSRSSTPGTTPAATTSPTQNAPTPIRCTPSPRPTYPGVYEGNGNIPIYYPGYGVEGLPMEGLSEDQKDVLALLVWGESSNGTVPIETSELKIWVFLNKLTFDGVNNLKKSVYSSWRGVNGQMIDENFLFEPNGINFRCGRIGISRCEEEITRGDTDQEWNTLLVLAQEAIAGNKVLQIKEIRDLVDIVHDQWHEQGTNSSVDITHGSVQFFEVPETYKYCPGSNCVDRAIDRTNKAEVEEFRNNMLATYQKWKKQDPNFNYVVTETYFTQGNWSFLRCLSEKPPFVE